MQVQELTAVSCYHCGDPCAEEHRARDGHDFCCQGCEVVYDLLQESGLCDYYSLGEGPGVKLRSDVDEPRTGLFDVTEVRAQLVEFSESGITRVRLNIPQMHCSSCIWLLENLSRLERSILRSRVSFATKELTITFREEKLALPELVRLLRRIGYGPQLTAGRTSGTNGDVVPRMMYVRLGVAAFIFGNTMLFSFPEYLGSDTEAGLKTGFQGLTILFSVPVVFFLSTDFFRTAWAGIRTRSANIDQPIALGIIALWTRSLWDVLTGVGPGYFDSLAGLLFFLLIGRWYQAYTYRALRFDRTLEDFLPLVVLRKRGEQDDAVKVADLLPGDIILVRDQELVPVDGKLLKGTAHIDNSFITGESLPVRKNIGEAIKAGGRQRGALIEVEVTRTFADSRLKRLWTEQTGPHARPAMPRMIEGVARRFTIAVILISVGAALYWWDHDPAQVWPVVTAVLIVACPCALALSMPFAYGHTIRLMGKRGLFLRDAAVVERMSRIDTVVFDKTGTLTSREAHEVAWHGIALNVQERSLVRSLTRNSTHPLSNVLAQWIKAPELNATVMEEIAGQGIFGIVEGQTVRVGSGAFCGSHETVRMHGEAHVHISIGGLHRGHFTIRKRARNGIVSAVKELRRYLRAGLLTGDAQVDPDLIVAFTDATVHTRCSPVDKSRIISEQQASDHHVLMVGDGLNDAGALAQSDVGITITETSAALTPASDGIMDASSLVHLPHFLRMARRARRIVVGSLLISLCYNLTGVTFAVSGNLTPLIAAILMPLSSVTVVGFVTAAVSVASRERKG